MSGVWDRVRELDGETLTTLHQEKPFIVAAVNDDGLWVVPQMGKRTKRWILRERIEHLAGLGLQPDEMRFRALKEYPDSRNTSYIAAVAFHAATPANAVS